MALPFCWLNILAFCLRILDKSDVLLIFFDTYKGPVDISFKYPKLWVIADSVSTVCFIGLFIVLLVYGLFKAVMRRSTDGHADCGRA